MSGFNRSASTSSKVSLDDKHIWDVRHLAIKKSKVPVLRLMGDADAVNRPRGQHWCAQASGPFYIRACSGERCHG